MPATDASLATLRDSPRAGPRFHAIVACAGVGQRAQAGMPKQYAAVAGVPMVVHTLRALLEVTSIHRVWVVLSPNDEWFDQVVAGSVVQSHPRLGVAKVGGATRAQSVLQGLEHVRAQGADDEDWALVHDAARCLLLPLDVQRLIDRCRDDAVGGLLAVPLGDTLKQSTTAGLEATSEAARSQQTLDRKHKWLAQTPQMFRVGALTRALRAAGSAVTDEASAMEQAGHAPMLVQGSMTNIKVTWPSDFELAERWMTHTMNPTAHRSTTTSMRIGEGWDTHALVEGRPLMLGGIEVPHTHGLLGHSDADALLHAITDALLGAAGLGDIGKHFPDTDSKFKGADSAVLLQEACSRVRAQGYAVSNVDATIIAQAPRMAPHIEAMRSRIAALLGVEASCVNVKAKTAEGMGPVGLKQAIEARAVCLLTRAGAASN